jgi:hypothetical protein
MDRKLLLEKALETKMMALQMMLISWGTSIFNYKYFETHCTTLNYTIYSINVIIIKLNKICYVVSYLRQFFFCKTMLVLTRVCGQPHARRGLLQHLCAGTGQTGASDRSDRSSGSPARHQRTPAWERPCWGRRTLGCSKVVMPPRTSSNAMETGEKHHGRIGKVG